MTLWHADNYDEMRERLIKEFEAASVPQAYWQLTATDEWLAWMQGQYVKYQSYVNQEADRTGRFPTAHMKNFLALVWEHGQKAMADDLRYNITKYG